MLVEALFCIPPHGLSRANRHLEASVDRSAIKFVYTAMHGAVDALGLGVTCRHDCCCQQVLDGTFANGPLATLICLRLCP
jgi:hypothetical protein